MVPNEAWLVRRNKLGVEAGYPWISSSDLSVCFWSLVVFDSDEASKPRETSSCFHTREVRR